MPIAMTKAEWERLKKWDPNSEDPEVQRRREYVKYLNDASREMTKSWPNSVENVNKRNEELRRARIEAAEQANSKFYKKYVKRKREEQQQLMHSARDTVFKNRDAPKMLLGAVIETVIQKERQEQVKFNEKLRQMALEQKRQDDNEIIRKAKEWNELMDLKRRRRFEANMQYQKDILDQAHEVSERNRIEYETELNLQKIDNIKANQQVAAIKKFEEEFKAGEKARIWKDMEQSRAERAARRRAQAARDRLDQRLLHVLLRSRATVQQQRRRTELQIKEEKQRVLDNISKKLESGDAAREAKDQQMLEKAVKEKEAIAASRTEAQARKKEQYRRQRVADREHFLQEHAHRLHEFNTLRQWDIMNRFKNAEVFEEFQRQQRELKQRKTDQYREDILALWKEREDREARERAETRHFYGELAERKIRDADTKLLELAAQLLQEARDKQRPEYALQRAVDRYCKMHRLYRPPDLPASLREHFRGYRPADRSGREQDPADDTPARKTLGEAKNRRDGIDHKKPSSSKRMNEEESVEDYKRVGRANGLQRRISQTTTTLPPLTGEACCKCQGNK